MSYVFSRPVAEKATYMPNEYIQFKLHNPGFSILPGSIRFSGVPAFVHDGVELDPIDVIYHDHDVGFEGLVNSWVIKVNGRTVENIQDYPRMRKSIISGNKTEDAILGESDGACRGSNGVMGGNTRDQMLVESTPNFSFKPDICLNKANQPIASSKGPIEISVRLEQPINFFYGQDADNTTTYTMSNLMVEYRIVPEAPEHKGELVMNVMNSMRQVVDSSNIQISLATPVPSNRVFASFLNQTASLDTTLNKLVLENPTEGINKVEWSINDSLAYEKFPFENEMEMRYNYLMAVNGKNNGLNAITIGQMQDYRKFGLGFSYYRYFDANSKFGLNVQLAAVPAVPYFIYLYFAGVIAL